MTRMGLAAAAAALGFLMATGSSFVPVSGDQAFAAPTRQERAAIRAARKAKRASCERQARERGLHALKRIRFVNACVKR